MTEPPVPPSQEESLASIATTLTDVVHQLEQIVDGFRQALQKWNVELGQ